MSYKEFFKNELGKHKKEKILYNRLKKLCFNFNVFRHYKDDTLILSFVTSFKYIEMVALVAELEQYLGAKFYKCINENGCYTIELKYEV